VDSSTRIMFWPPVLKGLRGKDEGKNRAAPDSLIF
jgi:hypothetical protein